MNSLVKENGFVKFLILKLKIDFKKSFKDVFSHL